MNILHVIRSLDPSQGGPPVVAACLAAAQAGLGHRVCLAYQLRAGEEDRAATLLSATQDANRVELLPLPVTGPLPLALPGLRRALRQHTAGRDMLHLHGVWDPVLPLAALAAKRAGLPYVLTPHGMLDPWCLRQKRFKKLLALRLFYADMLRGARFVQALNAAEGAQVQCLGLARRLEILPNGLFSRELRAMGEASPGDGTLRRDGRPYVLFLGRLHFKKGLDMLAQAFHLTAEAVPDADLVVVGPDQGEQDRFARSIDRLGLSARVRLPGPIYGPDKYAALRGAACFCLPSRQEGFSMAVLEALGCGTPVVLSHACNFPEADAAGAGRCVDLRPEALAEALAGYLSDQALRRRAGLAGRELVAARYTWETIAADMCAAYQCVDAGGAPCA